MSEHAMRELAERAYFLLCLALGRALRAARYSSTRVVVQPDGTRQVHKRRRFYAPLLIAIGNPLLRLLDTGTRVLPRLEWWDRERRLYEGVYASSIRIADGALILPFFGGQTLAALLENPRLADPVRTRVIALTVVALADLHRRGVTHGDAMAENVMVDLDAGVARWFDFETVHERRPRRLGAARLVGSGALHPRARARCARASESAAEGGLHDGSSVWRQADDVRALIATCLVRIAPERRAETLHQILDTYADDDVTREVAARFTIWQRPLAFHLAQAALSRHDYHAIGRALD